MTMNILKKILILLLVIVFLLAIVFYFVSRPDNAGVPLDDVTGTDPTLDDPVAELIPTIELVEPVGWGQNEAPSPAEGLAVGRFAEGLDHPRVLHALPNGDILVTQTAYPDEALPEGFMGMAMAWFFDKVGAGGPSPNQLVLLRDADGDGVAELKKILRDDFDSPSGIEWNDGKLYVAQHDAVLAFDYELGSLELADEATELMELPAGGIHWMRNLELSADGTKLYVAVGSASNIAENGIEAEEGRAMIWEYSLETKRRRPFAMGLRNANGLDFSPWTGELWTTVNERDMLGSDLVPDYLTNVPVGAQYGWPWVYWRDNFDRRVDAPIPAYLTEYARKPEYALGPHVAALGLAFTREGHLMGEKFASGAFIARHGSWNRKPPSGYDVVYVAFDSMGNPQGKPVPVLGSFLREDGKTRGRPTWVAWAGDGALLVSDDTAGIVWRVSAPGAEPGKAIEQITRKRSPPRRSLTGQAASFGKDDYAREEPAQ